MTLILNIVAEEGQRVFSRVLQVLETQRVGIRSFSGQVHDGEVVIDADVETDPSKAHRIEALLSRLENVRTVVCRAVVSLQIAATEDDMEQLARMRVNSMSPEP